MSTALSSSYSDQIVPQTNLLLESFYRDGYVLIENAIPREEIARLRDLFKPIMDAKVARFNLARVTPTDGRDRENSNVQIDFRPEGANHDLNRWNMHLPTTPDFINDLLVANPLALPVIKGLLGPDAICFIIASDTPYPGSGFQNIHQDFPRYGLTVNIPLVDFTEENAPLEVWPRSHVRDDKFHTGMVHLSKDEVRALPKGKRMLLKAGSIFIRDQRLVHRGTVNITTEPRFCLSIWYKIAPSFPIPHRAVADRLARIALHMRKDGRGPGGAVKNQKLLNWGNLFGRIVEETSGSDRDYRRRIPRVLWDSYSSDLKHLLRYASVEDLPQGKRSIGGSAILMFFSGLFILRGWWLKAFPQWSSGKSRY